MSDLETLVTRIEQSVGGRLDRIETDMSEMRKAVVQLARIEERQAAHVDGMHRMGRQIDAVQADVKAVSARVDTLEQKNAPTRWLVDGWAKFGWLVVGAVVALGLKLLLT